MLDVRLALGFKEGAGTPPRLQGKHHGVLNLWIALALVVGTGLALSVQRAASPGQRGRMLLEGSSMPSELLSLGLVTKQNAAISGQLCDAFLADNPSRRVAIVGNGPLSVEQRQQLGDLQRIVWFNRLESRQAAAWRRLLEAFDLNLRSKG
jgi:hypothetical protein